MGERFYVTVFGSQHEVGLIPHVTLAHTFAQFTEEIGSEIRRVVTISWLPHDGTIRLLGTWPGRNYSLAETLAWLDRNGSTDRWASKKTEIHPSLFESAVERAAELEAGSLQFVMIDSAATRPHDASNCIHAVSDLAVAIAKLGMLDTGLLHGIPASRAVYRYLGDFLIDPEELSADE